MTAYQFGNNPGNRSFSRDDGASDSGYDIATEDDGPNRYWVVRHLNRIGRTPDIAFIHRFDGQLGAIAAVARITGTPDFDEDGAWVPWELRVPPDPRWVEGADLSLDPAWRGRKPFTEGSHMFANPIRLDEDRLGAVSRRLAVEDRSWLRLD